jgi:tetratricopeptide (TPR) repeat protein
LLARQADKPALWFRRGNAFAEQGKGKKAAADFSEASRRQPGNPGYLISRHLALLGGGDEASYRDFCPRMLREFHESKGAATAAGVVWLAVFLPNPPKEALPLARQAVARWLRNGSLRGLLGAAHYRAGDFTEAVRWLTGAARQRKGGATTDMLLFLAMAHHLGEAEKASRYLHQATQQMKQDEAEHRSNWMRRLSLRLLRQEAEALLSSAKP